MKQAIVLGLCAVVLASIVGCRQGMVKTPPPIIRTWSFNNGLQINAKCIRVSETVTLESQDKYLIEFTPEMLSEADRRWLAGMYYVQH